MLHFIFDLKFFKLFTILTVYSSAFFFLPLFSIYLSNDPFRIHALN